MKISVKVVPGSSQEQVVGWIGQHLKIKVKAPPENGKANAAVVKLLAKALDIPTKSIRMISGVSSRQKVLWIDGMQRNR